MDTAPPIYQDIRSKYSVIISVQISKLFLKSTKIIEWVTPICHEFEIDQIVNYMLYKKYGKKYLNHEIKFKQIAKTKKYLVICHFYGQLKSGKGCKNKYLSEIIDCVYDENEAKLKFLEMKNNTYKFNEIYKLKFISQD